MYTAFFVARNVKILQGVCMRYLAIVFFVLFSFTTKVNALPECEGLDISKWDNCIGTIEYTQFGRSGYKILGVFRNGEAECGAYYHPNGSSITPKGRVHGLKTCKNSELVILPENHLKHSFLSLSKEQRKKVQKNLQDLGFYKASTDGVFGAATKAALIAYNKQNLNGAALTTPENVTNLINEVLNLKSVQNLTPRKSPDDTYKVASGTGFYISEDGHIITNHHVIDGCENMKVHSKGTIIDTLKIADDKVNDLALLKISKRPSHVFALTEKSPYPLQEVIVAGFPFGEQVSSTLKFTQGIVSSLAGLGNDYSQIQIDAAIQPGNSGGPILDEYGNIVAVAVAKLSLEKVLEDYGVIPENINFGVKASAVRNLMEGNAVPFKSPSTVVIPKEELSKNVTDGTVYLTCWMTAAQIEQMRTKKVLFEGLN